MEEKKLVTEENPPLEYSEKREEGLCLCHSHLYGKERKALEEEVEHWDVERTL